MTWRRSAGDLLARDSSASAPRAQIPTWAPSAASVSAIARPSPRLAAATSAPSSRSRSRWLAAQVGRRCVRAIRAGLKESATTVSPSASALCGTWGWGTSPADTVQRLRLILSDPEAQRASRTCVIRSCSWVCRGTTQPLVSFTCASIALPRHQTAAEALRHLLERHVAPAIERHLRIGHGDLRGKEFGRV
jgi:hypothetical protein